MRAYASIARPHRMHCFCPAMLSSGVQPSYRRTEASIFPEHDPVRRHRKCVRREIRGDDGARRSREPIERTAAGFKREPPVAGAEHAIDAGWELRRRIRVETEAQEAAEKPAGGGRGDRLGPVAQ